MWIWMMASALAGDLNFSPDRPGVGDSTGVVGVGHGMVEGGFTGVIAPGISGGSLGAMGRFGVLDPLEVRVRVPSLGFAGGGVGLGPVGVGAKFAADLTDSVAVSVVPEVMVPLNPVGVGASLSGNLSYAAGNVSPWLHVGVDSSIAAIVGGGVGAGLGSGGVYGNAAVTVGNGAVFPMVGAGGWLGISDAFQIDVGLDAIVSPIVILQPLVGVSGGF